MPPALQRRTSKKKGLAIALARAPIASPHYHEESSSWRRYVYQECTAGASSITHGCQAFMDCLRATEEVCGRFFCWVFGSWNADRMDDACVRLLECCVGERSS